MARQWIRLDVDFEDSDWLVDLSPLAQFAWVKFCCRVKAEGSGGMWRSRSVTALHRRLQLPEEPVAEMLAAALSGSNPALEEADGQWSVLNWHTYYPQDRTNALRQRRYREKQQGEGVTESNGVTSVTGMSRATVDVRRKTLTTTDTTDGRFEEFWRGYPKRIGGNPKQRARKAWNARIAEGAEPTDIIGGRDRYASLMESTGKVGTEYVMQAATFLGPDQRWTEDWTAAKRNGKPAPQAYTYDETQTEDIRWRN